jgi:hypothetical protein
MKNNNYILHLLILLTLLISSCEDLPPQVYEPKTYVETYLIVDHPLEHVKIMKTQALTDTFKYENTFIRDAEVLIHFNNRTLRLVTDSKGIDGYYYPDTNIKVLPETEYKLEIHLKDGSLITAKTFTPKRFGWLTPPPTDVYYPKDTVNFSDATDTIKIKWEHNPSAMYYFIRIACLDTALYGKYLTPPTSDSNRRTYKPYANTNSPSYTRTQIWSFIPVNETPVVWTFFKWYGKQRVSVFTPDFNFLKWSLQYFQSGQYDPLLGNIEGDGIGIFGSASQIDSDFFVYFPQQ